MTEPQKTEPDAAPETLIAEPGGRAKVWLWVVLGLALLAAVFIARRQQEPTLSPAVVTVQEAPGGGAVETLPPEPR